MPRLSCLFASLLADQTWLIHQQALEAFAHFAEVSRAQLWVQAFGSVNLCCTQILLSLKCLLLLTAQSGSELQLLHVRSAEGWCSQKRFQELEVKD